MKVSVVYALPDEQVWLPVDVDQNATVLSAIQASYLLEMFPNIDLDKQKVGIFGRATPLDSELKEGDRVEIYRPLIWQPEDEDDD
ncbi:RnfH family protein [Vibrio cincinnatiensis]|uniref:RnfH family protein n=1 Tax=Vibrio cincinnatiensis TaxID=675 RepID=UPI001EDF1371|nr:RnfH family protein [Vibrio cincinnatiensis]MCG3724290.1 RnfH family protein [Vibrio cincinnatiensis]